MRELLLHSMLVVTPVLSNFGCWSHPKSVGCPELPKSVVVPGNFQLVDFPGYWEFVAVGFSVVPNFVVGDPGNFHSHLSHVLQNLWHQ